MAKGTIRIISYIDNLNLQYLFCRCSFDQRIVLKAVKSIWKDCEYGYFFHILIVAQKNFFEYADYNIRQIFDA